VSSEARGKSYGLKIFLLQGKRPVARKPLVAISPVAARVYALPNCSPICYRVTTLGLNSAIFHFLGSRIFSGAP